MRQILGYIVCVILLSSCGEESVIKESPLFDLKDNQEIGIDFSNDLEYTREFNVYKYRNFYNGGGVALGDVNNDDLLDIYLVSNQSSNKLYLNKGDFKFEDITESAGVSGTRAWSTGVTFVDINADGFQDIYVCNSGDLKGDDKENELFVNNGDGTFTESAQAYNLNDKGYSTHAAFFDYDKDGDLDVYILNNSYNAIGSFNLTKNERPIRDLLGGDKLMENRGGKFFDVSEEAGIYGSVIGFGLGVTLSDFNGDNWDDIFISNDFFERDYLYLNNQDGTFDEVIENQMHSLSAASMGADAADVNNDGLTDLFVTDMLPSEYERLKTVTTFDDWNRYNRNLVNGYHHQFTRNMLQRNNGNGTFSELSRFAGVEASDWSWGALFFDMDNDGQKDLFIANGIYKDITNQDYLQYVANESVMSSIIQDDGVNYKELIDIIPSNKVRNHAYKNNGAFNFETYENSGLQDLSFSNGSAFGDLDNDGDYDLIVNNINMPCFVYENKGAKNNYLKIKLKGSKENPLGVGAKITISGKNDKWYYENFPAKGFQSTVDFRPNIGVGKEEMVTVQVVWSSGVKSEIKDVKTNQVITIEESKSNVLGSPRKDKSTLFSRLSNSIDYIKEENNYVDFNRERLIYHMRSTEGGEMSLGDLNGDGKHDLVIPGAKGFETQVFIGDNNRGYLKKTSADFEKVKEAEHVNSVLVDVDNDGDLDIYLASGGVEHSEYSPFLFDHLFVNDGSGNFSLSDQKLPSPHGKMSSKAVAKSDVDGDGDQDLFVGERIKIGKFGERTSGCILLNDGKGSFSDNTKVQCPELENIGMVTDAKFSDLDQDGDSDLVVCGEFMELSLFVNTDGKFKKQKIKADIPLSGWWNTIELIDVDQDGDQDLIAGNVGLNSRFSASVEKPIKLYYSDFDKNRFYEGVMTFTREDGKDYPYALRHNLIDQMKGLKKNFPDFESFKEADITAIFSPEQLEDAEISIANQLKTVLLLNDGNYNFTSVDLPPEVQYTPIYAIDGYDYDKDGDIDILMGGNLFSVVPEMGIYDSSYGLFLENQGDAKYSCTPDNKGFFVRGEIRDIKTLEDKVLVQVSRDSLITFRY